MAVPELPRTLLDTTMPNTAGYVTKTVGASGKDFTSINTAVNHTSVKDATTGIILSVTAGETFTETITLPIHTNPWVIIQSSLTSSLPAGVRVKPSDVTKMPKIVAAGAEVKAFEMATSAAHYRLVGLEITATAYTNGVVIAGTATETLDSQFPSFLYVDRCYVHADPTAGGRRGVTMNAKSQAVIDSYVSDWKEVGADAQAICGWNGPGPFKIVNNYLEGSGENVMFGGADMTITNLIPSDIEVRRNHFYKPQTWQSGHPTYAGTYWTIKNLFELKCAQRVLVEGNLFENNWGFQSDQNGFAILVTPRSSDGADPWAVVQDVTFRNNIIRHSGGGIQILGQDVISEPTRRLSISNNLWYDIDATKWTGTGWWMMYSSPDGGAEDVVIEHNTSLMSDITIIFTSTAASSPPITFRNNLVGYGDTGVYGEETGVHTINTIAFYVPGSPFTDNVFVNNTGVGTWPPANFPATTLFAASVAAVGFTDAGSNNYRLTASSPYYHLAADGSDLGVDMGQVWAAFGVETRRNASFTLGV